MKKLHARGLSRNQPIPRFDVILQHDWPIEQCLLHIRVFFGGKTERPCFDLFSHWLIKEITFRLPKTVFKVIRNLSISRGNREMSVVLSGYQILDPVQKRPIQPPAVFLQLFFTCFSFCLDCDKPSRITAPPVSRGRPFIFKSSFNQFHIWQHAERHCHVTFCLFQSQRERNGPFPSFQTPHFQNEVKCKTCHVKMSFICITIKFYFCFGLCTYPRFQKEAGATRNSPIQAWLRFKPQLETFRF